MDLIASGKTVKHRLTIREGLTSAEIVALVRRGPALDGEHSSRPPEGALLPETYIYSRGDTREACSSGCGRRWQDALAAAWAERRPDLPLAEPARGADPRLDRRKGGRREAERARIAAVFVNRLRLGMRLQADPTVIYALSNNGATKIDRR